MALVPMNYEVRCDTLITLTGEPERWRTQRHLPSATLEEASTAVNDFLNRFGGGEHQIVMRGKVI